jgi:hypothetical protein
VNNVLGLTGREPVIEVETKTFCSLCQRVIRRGDEAVSAAGRRGHKWLIHPDCALAQFTGELHRMEMNDVKRKTKSRAKRQPKKVRTSDGKSFCFFCRKKINEGDTFVLEENKPYHNSGRNSCLVRFRKVINAARSSLYK